ncbi:HAD family hydrolase [Azospirillum sp. TSO22-1]|uniref:HAD family hydrolase n=1 Tax=Azospirillum sp. TSO22-1 TaxID=716789 RepID=UPI000D61FA7C|nr:HAD family hydrolase [Azospirillum sp. TSO22-1]PWC45785.1 hypothetical protein TSO221_15405 [Azospirillum sp. TSO22-1]
MTQTYAFFDVDDTLIAAKSMFSFQDFWYAHTGDDVGRAAFEAEMTRLRAGDAPWEVLNRRYYAHFAGRAVAEVEAVGEAWFRHLEATVAGLYHAPIVAELRRHQAAGEEPVFVSGSFPALLAPVASRLGVRYVLATTMEVEDGRYTGCILPPQTIGAGKATAVRRFLDGRGVPAAACFAYGDDISDLPMLEAVGNPRVVAGGRGLAAHAAAVGWPVLSPH